MHNSKTVKTIVKNRLKLQEEIDKRRLKVKTKIKCLKCSIKNVKTIGNKREIKK